MLVGKYIPNLVAKPFQVSREYAQLIYDQTSPPQLKKVLKKWEQDNWAAPQPRSGLSSMTWHPQGPITYFSALLHHRQ
jgi:fatty acid synthase subunit alpha